MQFKNNILLIFLLILLASTSCNKDKNVKTVVNGTVINLSENKPLEGAEVDLRELYGFASNTGFNVKETTITDANGKFSFDFVATPSRSYRVIINRGDLYLSSVFEKIEKGKTNDVVLKPSIFGYLKMQINSVQGNDSLILSIDHQYADISGTVTYENGESFESSMSKTHSGKRFFQIEVFNNGSSTTYYDTIILEPYQEHFWSFDF